jgi:hypothetical protein
MDPRWKDEVDKWYGDQRNLEYQMQIILNETYKAMEMDEALRDNDMRIEEELRKKERPEEENQ